MTPRTAPAAARSERGTVLMLFPAAVLILCVLGALAVDSANATMRRRELQSAADAAANDAAALAIDPVALRAGLTVLDPALARLVVDESLDRQQVRGLRRVEVRIVDSDTVEVELVAEHPSVFARAVPGADDLIEVPARARARAVTAGEGSVPR